MNYENAMDIFDNYVCNFDFDKTDIMSDAINTKIEDLESLLNKLKEAREVLFKKTKETEKIKLSINDALKLGIDWEIICNECGFNYYAMNEGLDKKTMIELPVNCVNKK